MWVKNDDDNDADDKSERTRTRARARTHTHRHTDTHTDTQTHTHTHTHTHHTHIQQITDIIFQFPSVRDQFKQQAWLPFLFKYNIIIIIITNSLTARVIGVSQMISQPVSSIFFCSPLPSWTWRTPSFSISWFCLPTSPCICLVFFPLSRCPAGWFRPELTGNTSISLQFASLYGGQEVVWSNYLLDLGTDFPRW